MFGSVCAFTSSAHVNLGPVVAASLVAIVAHLIVPHYATPIYCGAFVGMTSHNLLFNHTEVAIAEIIAGVIFLTAKNIFPGYGEKLSAIALIGTFITGISLARDFTPSSVFDWRICFLVILIASVAAPLTHLLNFIHQNGAVLASRTVGLLSGLILPSLFPDKGGLLAIVAICASFIGMSSRNRCPKFWLSAIAGFVTGIIFILAHPFSEELEVNWEQPPLVQSWRCVGKIGS